MAADVGEVKELRLALVCYGGVSLAVYMHGIAKEIQALVVASTAYEKGHQTNPFEPGRSEYEWWNVLDERARTTGVRTRVVVDIISGTSAGGINGVCLAKALSCNQSQDGLTKIWLEKGDINLLLRGPRFLPIKARAAIFLIGALARPKKALAPLRGDKMCGWLLDAFAAMDASAPALANSKTLVPEGQSLDLYATMTDFRGRQRAIPIDSPKWVHDRTHRHLLRFRHDGSGSQFGKEYSQMLAFAARATSSFPGGFSAITLNEFENTEGYEVDLQPMLSEFFSEYELASIDPNETSFIDGGVLDNAPFGATVNAIPHKSASTQTDRRLLYIEPDPALDVMKNEKSAAPSWLRTIWGGLAGIPRQEPVVDDLIAVAHRNDDVLRVRDVVESSFETVRGCVAEVVGGRVAADVTPQQLETWLNEACVAATNEAGFGYGTYARLRISSVVDGFADKVNKAAGYPNDSFQSSFVREIMRTWASTSGVMQKATDLTQTQLQFMADFDLAFMQRQIRFAISALNWWYRNDDIAPSRANLDESKRTLYSRLGELNVITEALTDCQSVAKAMKTVFASDNIFTTLDSQNSVTDVISQNQPLFVAMHAEIRDRIKAPLAALAKQVHADVIAMSSRWNAQAREDFLVRYLGFPFWDVLTFPVQSLSGVNERDAVQVARLSPRDVSLLKAPADQAKLAGIAVHHFGAFFSRKGRENDYLWGRLDAVERMMALLTDDELTPGLRTAPLAPCGRVFEAVLQEEASRLTHIDDVMKDLNEQARKLTEPAQMIDLTESADRTTMQVG